MQGAGWEASSGAMRCQPETNSQHVKFPVETGRATLHVIPSIMNLFCARAWFKEVFSFGERRRVGGIGLFLLLAVALSVMGQMLMAPRRGNGVNVPGVKKGFGAQ